MRRNDVASTSFRRHVPSRFLINQCQIIAFLVLKCYILQNSRIELRGIVLPFCQYLKSKSYIYYYFTLQLGIFVIFPVSQKLQEMWVDFFFAGGGGGGGKGYVGPPLKLLGGPGLPAPFFLRLGRGRLVKCAIDSSDISTAKKLKDLFG